MRINRIVSPEMLALLPACIIRSVSPSEFSVEDDHENFLAMCETIGAFDMAESVRREVGFEIEEGHDDDDDELFDDEDQDDEWVRSLAEEPPEPQRQARSMPCLSDAAALPAATSATPINEAQLEALRRDFSAISERGLGVATRISAMSRFSNPSLIGEAMDKVRRDALAHAKVSNFGYNGGDIVIVTSRLVSKTVGRGDFDLGQMEIRFSYDGWLSGTVRGIKFFNLTHAIPDCGWGQAGHVSYTGEPCLGGWMISMSEYASFYNIVGVIDQLIGFLENPDESDAMGRYILKFPRA